MTVENQIELLVGRQTWNALLQMQGSFEHVAQVLAIVQQLAKRRFKVLAACLHPDLTGGDVNKADLLAQLSNLNDRIQDLKPDRLQTRLVFQILSFTY